MSDPMRDLALTLTLELASTVDGEWGCCHDADDLMAGGRVPDYDGDEFEPLPETCQGKRVLDEWLPKIRTATEATR